MKLYEIANNYQHVLQLADEGLLDNQTAKDTLEAIGGEFELKAKNCMMIVKKLESDAAGIKAEIDRLKLLQDQTNKSIDSLKDYIKSSMEAMGSDRLDLGIFKLTLKAPTKAVEIIDTSLIPDDYWRVVPETKAVDKSLIATMIKTGKEVPGASLVDGKRALLIK